MTTPTTRAGPAIIAAELLTLYERMALIRAAERPFTISQGGYDAERGRRRRVLTA
jgi:hypothetical protein